MGSITLKEKIKEIQEHHILDDNGVIVGECITDPNAVGGTMPAPHKNMIDLPMTDVSGADIAIGCALAGRRPIFVVRFQNFMLLNGSPFISYAATYKDIHGIPVPVFIRASGTDRAGVVHSGILHGLFSHFPGFYVSAPMSPNEYQEVWNSFMDHDIPFYVSESRSALMNNKEFENEIYENADITLFGIAESRWYIIKAAEILRNKGYVVNVIHILWLKPFRPEIYNDVFKDCSLGLVCDPDYEICGSSESIAYELMTYYDNAKIYAMGLPDKVKSFKPGKMNETPKENDIVEKSLLLLSRKGKL